MVRFAVPEPETPRPLPVPAASNESPSSQSSAATGSSSSSSSCLKCRKNKITYEADPCGCPLFCTDCARKFASGGKCKTCHEFYGGLRRLRVP